MLIYKIIFPGKPNVSSLCKSNKNFKSAYKQDESKRAFLSLPLEPFIPIPFPLFLVLDHHCGTRLSLAPIATNKFSLPATIHLIHDLCITTELEEFVSVLTLIPFSDHFLSILNTYNIFFPPNVILFYSLPS